jgi:peptidylprolyl isomerase
MAYISGMTTRALPLSCLLSVLLAACVAPPSIDDAAETEAKAAQNPADQQYPPDPVFAGKPVAVTKLPGGILVEDFVVGDGPEAKPGAEVSVHYRGTLDDGAMFDTSAKRKRPFVFTIGEGRVIKGWDMGVASMKVGGKRRLTIPPELAYGAREKKRIPANSRLTFEIELVELSPPLPDPKPESACAGEPLRRTELDGGLIVEVFAEGTGRAAAIGDEVTVHYTGKLDDGTVFDSSVTRHKPISFVLGAGRVIKGWELGIAGMKTGELRRLTIPAELAYGARARGKIPANARLTFIVELMRVREGKRPPARNRRGR